MATDRDPGGARGVVTVSGCSETEWLSAIDTKKARKPMISDEGAHVVYRKM